MIRTFILILLALLVLLLSGNIVTLYTDGLWFQEIDQFPVFLTVLLTQLKLGFLLGFIFFVLLYANMIWAHRYRTAAKWHRTEQWLELPLRTQLDPHISKVIPTLALLFAFFVGLSGAVQWENFLLFKNPTSFGITDPVFGQDYAYYTFQYPFLKYIQGWLTSILFLIMLFTAIIYFYHGGWGVTKQGIFMDSTPKRHLLILTAALLATKAFGYRLSAYELLFTIRGVVTGAIYADVHARIPALNLLTVLALIAAAAVFGGGFLKGWRLPLVGVVTLFVISLLGATLYPDLLHRFRVQPNEIVLERPAIKQNIEATRFAFGLNDIEAKDFSAEDNLSIHDIVNNDLTIKNIRLWDHGPNFEYNFRFPEAGVNRVFAR